ncbi:MAG: hypothetical protein WD876_02630, partial [Candidatus Pacearchaeota archaeon]
MNNRKSVSLVFVVGILIILSFSFVSASWLGDFFDSVWSQITGKATLGTCSGDVTAYCHGFDQAYSSGGAECDAESACQWSDYDGWCTAKTDYCATLTSSESCQAQSGCSWSETSTNLTPTCPEGYNCLNSDSPKTTFTFNNTNYDVELIYASSKEAHIKVINKITLLSQSKTVNKLSNVNIAGLNVYLKDSKVQKFSPDVNIELKLGVFGYSPSVSISAEPTSINPGNSSVLTWESENVNSCIASGAWGGTKPTIGFERVYPNSNSIYSLTCTGGDGTSVSSININVNTFRCSYLKTS